MEYRPLGPQVDARSPPRGPRLRRLDVRTLRRGDRSDDRAPERDPTPRTGRGRPDKAAGPGGSPWQCFELGVGYWGLEALVDNAIEVRVTYLTAGELNNIGIDLL